MSLQFMGLIGSTGSGKDFAQEEIARMLHAKGIPTFETSMSGVLRTLIAATGRREYPTGYMAEFSGDLCETEGLDILARLTLESVQTRMQDAGFTDGVVFFNGIRRPEEAAFFKKKGAKILGIRADFETRWERVRKRGRTGDPTTPEEFAEFNKQEMHSDRKWGNQVEACYAEANVIIENNGSKEELLERLREELVNLGIEGQNSSKEQKN